MSESKVDGLSFASSVLQGNVLAKKVEILFLLRGSPKRENLQDDDNSEGEFNHKEDNDEHDEAFSSRVDGVQIARELKQKVDEVKEDAQPKANHDVGHKHLVVVA